MFNIRSTDGKFDKVVSITGNNSTTIKYIRQGEYTITEISDWSWKYNAIEAKIIPITTEYNFEFENSRNENKLLGDESNINNVFKIYHLSNIFSIFYKLYNFCDIIKGIRRLLWQIM